MGWDRINLWLSLHGDDVDYNAMRVTARARTWWPTRWCYEIEIDENENNQRSGYRSSTRNKYALVHPVSPCLSPVLAYPALTRTCPVDHNAAMITHAGGSPGAHPLSAWPIRRAGIAPGAALRGNRTSAAVSASAMPPRSRRADAPAGLLPRERCRRDRHFLYRSDAEDDFRTGGSGSADALVRVSGDRHSVDRVLRLAGRQVVAARRELRRHRGLRSRDGRRRTR